jgi:diketogulonate reductase-like aldo/keto reductase
LVDFCAAKGIVVEAYSPLTHGERLNDPRLLAIARKYPTAGPEPEGRWSRLLGGSASRPATKSPAQILIRWALQRGFVVIPKSAKRSRIVENSDVFDFEITEEDMRLLDGFNEDLRTCWDPTGEP